MSNWQDLYPSVAGLISTTTPIQNTVDVVDLRREFNNLVLGTEGETPIGKPFILRRMRRTTAGKLVPCSCIDSLTKEPDRDFLCPYCLGAGNLWDEELITGYEVVASAPGGSNASDNYEKTQTGAMYLPASRFFLPYNIAPVRDDRIVTLELDANGRTIIPYIRVAVFELMLVRPLRSDNGKIDFWVCNGQKMGPLTHGSVS